MHRRFHVFSMITEEPFSCPAYQSSLQWCQRSVGTERLKSSVTNYLFNRLFRLTKEKSVTKSPLYWPFFKGKPLWISRATLMRTGFPCYDIVIIFDKSYYPLFTVIIYQQAFGLIEDIPSLRLSINHQSNTQTYSGLIWYAYYKSWFLDLKSQGITHWCLCRQWIYTINSLSHSRDF